MPTFLDDLYNKFKEFSLVMADKGVAQRVRKQYDGLLERFEKVVLSYDAESRANTIEQALAVICNAKSMPSYTMSSLTLRELTRCGFSLGELATLTGRTTQNVSARMNMSKERGESDDDWELMCPDELKKKPLEEWDEEDKYLMATFNINAQMRFGRGREKLEASKQVILERLNKQIRDVNRMFKQLKVALEYIMSEMLPDLQKKFSKVGVDSKILLRDALITLQDRITSVEVPEVKTPEMDDKVYKVKKRGKWYKEQKDMKEGGTENDNV